jgi:hypothetical protein
MYDLSSYHGCVTEWNKWFAWYPVTIISKKRVWLEWCYKRTVFEWSWEGLKIDKYQYANIFDILGE